ncbi:MAG: hypothetical protein RLZZ502_1582, partial [Pseudomonadota bacterium]
MKFVSMAVAAAALAVTAGGAFAQTKEIKFATQNPKGHP